MLARPLVVAASVALAVFAFATGVEAQSPLHTVIGDYSNDWFGRSVAVAGDINADGYQDFVVGAPATGAFTPFGPGFVRAFSGLDGSTVFDASVSTTVAYFGACVRGAGDCDGDGHADVLVGIPPSLVNPRGFASVFSGQTGLPIHNLASGVGRDLFGTAVQEIGDVNGDGTADLAVGAPMADFGVPDVGGVFVYSGATAAPIRQVYGTPDSRFGTALCSLGDVNLDGIPDMGVGAAIFQSGVINYVRAISGADGSTLYTVNALSTLDAFGSSVDSAGDVNGDGAPDWIVGAPGLVGFSVTPGSARVLSGPDGAQIHNFVSATLFDTYGTGVARAGDVNDDGYDDVWIGAPTANLTVPAVTNWVGRVELRSGLDGQKLLELFGKKPNQRLGFALAGGVDLNNDGVLDAIVASPTETFAGVALGRVDAISLP